MRRSVVLAPIAISGLVLGACAGAGAPRSTTTTLMRPGQLRPTQSVSVPAPGGALATACVATLSKTQPRAGSTDTLRVSTAPPNAAVRVLVIAGSSTRHLSATTDGSGSAALPFRVQRPSGTVPVDLIVTVGATANCATSYTVVP